MGPVRQNPIQRTVSLFICVCIALCTITAHNTAQNIPDNFPPYPPDNHHCSDDVYLREGEARKITVNRVNTPSKMSTNSSERHKIPTTNTYSQITGERTRRPENGD